MTLASPPDEEEARCHVRMLVWPGFATREQAMEMLDETLGDGIVEGNAASLTTMLAEEWDAKREAERNWPGVTDCDRLERSYQALELAGYVCLHDAGFEMSDGLHDVGEVWRHRGGTTSEIKGYCFYHRQDVERALESDELLIAFGAFDNAPASALSVGHAVVAAFVAGGLAATWDGTAGKRIRLKPFLWRRRSPA